LSGFEGRKMKSFVMGENEIRVGWFGVSFVERIKKFKVQKALKYLEKLFENLFLNYLKFNHPPCSPHNRPFTPKSLPYPHNCKLLG
jgi:hypothetical protein